MYSRFDLEQAENKKRDPLPYDSESLAEQRWVMPFNEESHIFAFRFGDRKVIFGD